MTNRIKIIVKLVLSIIVILNSPAVLAGADENAKGEKTCYIFKQNGLVKKGSCTYEGSEGGNMFGGFSDFTYNIRGYGKIDASDSQQAEEDAKGQPINIYTYRQR